MHDPLAVEMALAPYLDAEERVLWSGQPRHGLRLQASDAIFIPFSLMWGGFAFFWEASVFATGTPLFFKLWGIPFVLVGCYMIVGRFFVDARIRARTFYAVTNERVLIISGLFHQHVKSLALHTLNDVSLMPYRDGSGTITFGSTAFASGLNPGGSWPGARRYMPPCFDRIEQAREVYGTIRLAQKAVVVGH